MKTSKPFPVRTAGRGVRYSANVMRDGVAVASLILVSNRNIAVVGAAFLARDMARS